MQTKELQGNPEEQEIAGWMARLLMQRGYSYALASRIELGREELLEYLISQNSAANREVLASRIEAAVAENTSLFRREDIDGDTIYWVTKRDLLTYVEPPQVESRPTPPAPRKVFVEEPSPVLEPEIQAVEVEQQMPPPPPGETHSEVSEWAVEEQIAEEAARTAPAEATDSVSRSLEELPITTQYKLAILQALHRAGGSAKAAEVVQMIPQLMTLPEDHRGSYARGPEGKSEEPKYVKYVHSARRFLIQEGELESAARGIWRITDRGKQHLEEAGVS